MRLRYVLIGCAAALALYLAASGAAISPVADAAMKGDQAGVRSLLAQKADVNAPQDDGATAIEWAAYRNDLDMADRLIAAGANVKTPNREGATPLYLACIYGSPAMIDKLLRAGADPNEEPSRERLPSCWRREPETWRPSQYCSITRPTSTRRSDCAAPRR